MGVAASPGGAGPGSFYIEWHLGRVREREAGSPGTYALAGERVLRCLWHGWEFDLESSACLDDPALRAAVYPVEIANGIVRVRA